MEDVENLPTNYLHLPSTPVNAHQLMYRSRDASSDDMIGEVCVRNSRSRLRKKVVYSLVKG